MYFGYYKILPMSKLCVALPRSFLFTKHLLQNFNTFQLSNDAELICCVVIPAFFWFSNKFNSSQVPNAQKVPSNLESFQKEQRSLQIICIFIHVLAHARRLRI